jgi:hypothetical protein
MRTDMRKTVVFSMAKLAPKNGGIAGDLGSEFKQVFGTSRTRN